MTSLRATFLRTFALIATLAGPVVPLSAQPASNAPLGSSPESFPSLARLSDAETHQETTFNLDKRTKTFRVNRGQTVTLAETTGTGCINNIWLTYPGWFAPHWNHEQAVDQSVLKTMILRIYWDGSETPAVESPVGDFFGNGLAEISTFTSAYFGMSSGGFFCKFPMPFRKGFKITIENRDKTVDTDIFCNVLYQRQPVPEDAAYFHAQFRTGKNPGPEPTPILEARGSGHYVGCTVSAQGEQHGYMSFLEAPEYVYIDEDWEKPRIVGTGLEDYFLGGWYFREGPFQGELHGVPSKDPHSASIAMYRIHTDDAIHFNERIKFDFVNPWAPERLKPFAYSSCAFFYLDSPEGQNPPPPGDDELIPWYRIKNTDHQSIP